MGLMFATLGTLFFVSGIFLILDPTATIKCNGVVTTSPGCKQSYTAFGAGFAVIGLAVLFAKNHWLDKLFVWSESVRSMLPWPCRRAR
jgi:hypothetical protein